MSDDLELQMPTDLRVDPDAVPLVSRIGGVQESPVDTAAKRRGILCLTVETPTTSSFSKVVSARPPSRWKSPEFIFYGICFAIVVPILVWKPIELSSCTSSLHLILLRHNE